MSVRNESNTLWNFVDGKSCKIVTLRRHYGLSSHRCQLHSKPDKLILKPIFWAGKDLSHRHWKCGELDKTLGEVVVGLLLHLDVGHLVGEGDRRAGAGHDQAWWGPGGDLPQTSVLFQDPRGMWQSLYRVILGWERFSVTSKKKITNILFSFKRFSPVWLYQWRRDLFLWLEEERKPGHVKGRQLGASGRL